MELTKREQRVVERRFEQLVKACDDLFFELEGTPTFNLKRSDGSFRHKPVPTEISYQLSHIYIGQKGQIIIGMKPEDARDFEYFEVEARKIDAVIPMMGTQLSEMIELSAPIENINALLIGLVNTTVRENREAEAKAAEAALKNYDAIEEYGAF